MNQDRFAGTARNVAGKVQEGFGKVAGDAKTETEGVMNQAAGAVQDAYGKTMDAAADGAKQVKDAAIKGEDMVRHFIEDQPYTSTAIALAIGVAIGLAFSPKPAPRSRWEW